MDKLLFTLVQKALIRGDEYILSAQREPDNTRSNLQLVKEQSAALQQDLLQVLGFRTSDTKELEAAKQQLSALQTKAPDLVNEISERLRLENPNKFFALGFKDLNENQVFSKSVSVFESAVKQFTESIGRGKEQGFVTQDTLNAVNAVKPSQIDASDFKTTPALQNKALNREFIDSIMNQLAFPNNSDLLKRTENNISSFNQQQKQPDNTTTEAAELAIKNTEDSKKTLEQQKEHTRKLSEVNEALYKLIEINDSQKVLIEKLLLDKTSKDKPVASAVTNRVVDATTGSINNYS